MRKTAADRGMTFGLKYQPRQVFRGQVFRGEVFRDSGARDNEETIIGTQLRLGDGHTAIRVGLAKSGGR
jgi:hypothetical protein